jgi:hypothetical protein
VIVDSLVKTQVNKHPVGVIWGIETSVMLDIAIILRRFNIARSSCPMNADPRG